MAKRLGSAGEALSPVQARALFDYNRYVFERYVRRIRRLPWEEAIRERETGHQSLFQTLVHILNVHEVWIGYIIQGKSSDPELEKLFQDPLRKPGDWKGFSAYNRRVWNSIGEFMQGMAPRDMSRTVHAFWMPGKYTVSDGLMQTTFEQAHHLGEIIGALWQQDIEPPSMTWIEIQRAVKGR